MIAFTFPELFWQITRDKVTFETQIGDEFEALCTVFCLRLAVQDSLFKSLAFVS